MRTTDISLGGALLEVSYTYTGPYKGSETDPPEPASIELECVAVKGFKGSDLLDWLTPGALAYIEEQLMEFMDPEEGAPDDY